jgi:hypothetical protein
MLPAVIMAPVVVKAPEAIAADAARTIIGQDDVAAGIRVISSQSAYGVIIVVAFRRRSP